MGWGGGVCIALATTRPPSPLLLSSAAVLLSAAAGRLLAAEPGGLAASRALRLPQVDRAAAIAAIAGRGANHDLLGHALGLVAVGASVPDVEGAVVLLAPLLSASVSHELILPRTPCGLIQQLCRSPVACG